MRLSLLDPWRRAYCAKVLDREYLSSISIRRGAGSQAIGRALTTGFVFNVLGFLRNHNIYSRLALSVGRSGLGGRAGQAPPARQPSDGFAAYVHGSGNPDPVEEGAKSRAGESAPRPMTERFDRAMSARLR